MAVATLRLVVYDHCSDLAGGPLSFGFVKVP